MRAYFWGNMYLSSIQQGIQAGHVIAEMAVEYDKDGDFGTWAEFHKTMILLNGGMSCNLKRIKQHFSDVKNPFEWSWFNESTEALDGATTCIGIILPESIYENARLMRESMYNDNPFDSTGVSEWEFKLYEIMNSCRLAS